MTYYCLSNIRLSVLCGVYTTYGCNDFKLHKIFQVLMYFYKLILYYAAYTKVLYLIFSRIYLYTDLLRILTGYQFLFGNIICLTLKPPSISNPKVMNCHCGGDSFALWKVYQRGAKHEHAGEDHIRTFFW